MADCLSPDAIAFARSVPFGHEYRKIRVKSVFSESTTEPMDLRHDVHSSTSKTVRFKVGVEMQYDEIWRSIEFACDAFVKTLDKNRGAFPEISHRESEPQSG